ncbi:MAG: sigma-54-dependent Fis family transcriptional regulator [Planctomycetes bacterium HGW-Planctomycetes-1]|nr:MAG: sigma-54-dependent Fis family transcriptional regulator [Planctomycetes bacterium HGW-Planctomycetes-1]
MAEKPAILIIDDEAGHADVLAEALAQSGGETIAVYDAKNAIELLSTKHIDIVITDLNLHNDKINGIDILKTAKEQNPNSDVILITAYATIETCKEALREGAFDYLVKPIDIDQLRAMTERVLKKFLTASGAAKDRDGFKFDGVIGKSGAMRSVLAVLERVAPTNITVLIEGESGTGKELLAQAIHENSLRRNNAFKPINCAGFTESLLESELFGHSRGAFTGATETRKGLFEVADKGTLFLDEIGDMPLAMQAKLLRVLEDGIIVPVGSNKSTVVDVRVISATNHDLDKLVEQGKFRQDLYFRIKGVSVTVPPLRDRVEDIGRLADYFLTQAVEELGKPKKTISDSALNILKAYNWPGNIRQLRNCIRTMVVMGDSEKLDVKDIPAEIYQVRQISGQVAGGASLDALEKQAIIDVLAKTQNNRKKAAKLLGIGERTLYRKIKEYGIQ